MSQSGKPRLLQEVRTPQYASFIHPAVFIAGGMATEHDWQAAMITMLADLPITVVNPRRSSCIANAQRTPEEIAWEYHHLRCSALNVFWFPKESECAITLFELGVALAQRKIVRVGVDPDYRRRLDVECQTALLNGAIEIVHSLYDLAAQIRKWRVSTEHIVSLEQEKLPAAQRRITRRTRVPVLPMSTRHLRLARK